jgi:hypothetical protein
MQTELFGPPPRDQNSLRCLADEVRCFVAVVLVQGDSHKVKPYQPTLQFRDRHSVTPRDTTLRTVTRSTLSACCGTIT